MKRKVCVSLSMILMLLVATFATSPINAAPNAESYIVSSSGTLQTLALRHLRWPRLTACKWVLCMNTHCRGCLPSCRPDAWRPWKRPPCGVRRRGHGPGHCGPNRAHRHTSHLRGRQPKIDIDGADD